jgi:hypothetical protein
MTTISKTTRADRTVRLREDGQYVFVTPPVPALAEVFFTRRHQPIDMGADGIWAVPRAEPLVWPTTCTAVALGSGESSPTALVSGVPAQQCFRGLGPLVATELMPRGYHVVWEREPLAALPEPALAGRTDPSVLRFIHTHERGVVRCGPGVRVHDLVGQVAAAWPGRRIVVVATRTADVGYVSRALAQEIPGVGRLTPKNPVPTGTRVIVATPAALGLGPAAIEHRDLCLVLDPDEMFSAGAHQYAMNGVRHLWRARLFGFLPASKRLPPLLRDHVRALFGFDEHVVPAHGCTRRQVRVVFQTLHGGPRLEPDASAGSYPILRAAVHDGGLRNRLVRNLVGALTAGDKSALKAKYPAVAPLVTGRVRRTVVYADNAGHGLKLARGLRLPLVVDVLADRASLTADDIRVLDRGAVYSDHPTQPVVVTTEGLRHLGRFDVVVRADGGVGDLPLPARHLMNPAGDDRDLVVIDFRDADVALLRPRSRRRAAAYRTAGWEIVGEPTPSPLEQFKADRPEVLR